MPGLDAKNCLSRLAELLLLPEEELDLGEAALWVATVGGRQLEIEHWLGKLDELALAVKERVEGAGGEQEHLEALLNYLFREDSFCGVEEDYYAPHNSFLDQVLLRKQGLPITLAVVVLEVGRRVGVSLKGVGFPGHFLVKICSQPGAFLDPFHVGRILSIADCREMLRGVQGTSVRQLTTCLEPVSKREILARMLRNLKASYLGLNEPGLALEVLDRLLVVCPGAHEELRDRGLLQLTCGAYSRAVEDLAGYLESSPRAPDRAPVEEKLAEARSRLWALN